MQNIAITGKLTSETEALIISRANPVILPIEVIEADEVEKKGSFGFPVMRMVINN